MKKLTILTAMVFCAAVASAQSFVYSGTTVPIPDNNTNVNIPLSVAGVSPTYMSATYGLKEVIVNINHPWDSDIKISLKSPNGSVAILSLHNGSSGANYTNTHFRMDGINGPIVNAAAPFTGNYIPDQSLNLFNSSFEPANGLWNLMVIDEFPTEAGIFLNYTLVFGNNPPPDPLGMICSTTNASGCVCRNGGSDCDLVPDLICSHNVIRDGWGEQLGVVDFPNAIINIGAGPLEMKPTGSCFCDTMPVACTVTTCPDGTAPKERVNQRIYHKNTNGIMTYTETPAGTQSYHPTHGHVHAQDFFQFSLRSPSTNPDPLTWPIIGESVKTGYCLINMGDCSSQDSICISHGQVLTNADIINYNLGSVTGCGSNGQGVFVGRYDIYSSGFGQTISVPNVCNGLYYLVVNVDPFNNFAEEDETNNVVAVPIQLNSQAGPAISSAFAYASNNNFTYAFFNYTAGVTSYIWDFGDGNTATGNFPQHTYAAPGQYTVTLTLFNGSCSSSSSQVITISPVSIAEVNSGINAVNVSPNPSKGDFTIEFALNNASPIKVEMLNMLGQEVNMIFNGKALSGKHSYEIKNLNTGSYLVKITANDKTFIKKVVKL